MGFKRYGFGQGAAMIARDISEAASYFASIGFRNCMQEREGTMGIPVQYLGANVPQSWVAGSSVFQFLQAILGLHADAHKKTAYRDAVLPTGFPTSPCITCALEQAQ